MSTSQHTPLIDTIEAAWEARASLSPANAPKDIADAVHTVITALDAGTLRVAEKINGDWVTHQWIKKAVLLSFRLKDNQPVRSGDLQFFDKVETKFAKYSDADFKASGVRVVPPATARRGAFIGKNVVLMPSYVNIGAYVDEG
ncbi:MAG: 2,3,4,5-tetrahydropyridine-2,6-dicarboxylate N-succinyltransferase, partial [Pseudomonadota bacterium]